MTVTAQTIAFPPPSGSSLKPSILDLLVDRQNVPWRRGVVLACLLLAFAPIVAAHLQGLNHYYWLEDEWRSFFQSPAVLAYILLNVDRLAYMPCAVARSLRPAMAVTSARFEQLMSESAAFRPRRELMIGLVGAVGLVSLTGLVTPPPFDHISSWLMILNDLLAAAAVSWVIYRVLSHTRALTRFYQEPLCIDLFDLSPFDGVGRYYLRFAVTFLGAITLLTIFVFSRETLQEPDMWVLYAIMTAVPVLVFFFSMRPVHRKLAAARSEELAEIQCNLSHAYRSLKQRKVAGEDAVAAASELSTWFACQQELYSTRTWPFDTRMLRTLVVSALVPISAGMARVVLPLFLGGR